MPLTRVTITGADSSISPPLLTVLSRAFPFVEWGILFSTSREGTPRYPDAAWRLRLGSAWLEAKDTSLSAHLCGALARGVMSGSHDLDDYVAGMFRRVQLNGWTGEPSGLPERLAGHRHREFILQVRDESSLPRASTQAILAGNCSALWDCSGGRGIAQSSWPAPPAGLSLGYAGGITPDNVVDVLGVLTEVVPKTRDYWIDLESGVRTDDKFDIAKVQTLLERAAPFVGRTS